MITACGSSKAQSVNDPSYSEHNYKHPNKAEKIKNQKASKPEIYLQELKKDSNEQRENSLDAEANYKCVSAEKYRTKKFTTSSSVSAKPFHLETGVNNNYHQRFPSRQRSSGKSKIKSAPNHLADVKR